MPNIAMTLPEVEQSVSRPIIIDIVSQIQELTKIDKNTPIFFSSESQRLAQPGTTIENGSKDARFGNDRYLFIEVEDDFDLESVSSTAINQREYPSVFSDKNLGVTIAPVYATTNVTINFKYRTPSKTEAKRWRDDVRIRISQMRDINLHDVTYHYLLPKPYLKLLEVIHTNREAVAGYGDTLDQYVVKHVSERLTLLGDLTGGHMELGVSETQTRIVGMFGFDAIPEKPERDDQNGSWTISFSYKFSYERPIGCNMRYPIMVHNQLLPERYVRYIVEGPNLDNVDKHYSNSLGSLSRFEHPLLLDRYVNVDSVIRIPEEDYFQPANTIPGTGTVISALCELDLTQPNLLLNLNELGDVCIDEEILDFIRKVEYPYIGKLYRSVFQVALYRNSSLVRDRYIECDRFLNIRAVEALDPRNCHRVHFNIVADITLLDREAIERLRKYPSILVKVVTTINELLRNFPGIENLKQSRQVSVKDFSLIYQLLTGLSYNGDANTFGRDKINDGTVVTKRFNDPFRITTAGTNHSLDVLKDVRGVDFEEYRRNMVRSNRVMTTSIIAERVK